ncbi:MAG: 30S ribosomal protein S20 [Acidobacteriota bacterium]|nr:30S ribosomal protein S20 [Acidobacteriota bacterium]
MANHKSALKKSKQDLVRRSRNRAGKSRLRTALKKYRAALAGGENCTDKLPGLVSLIDTSAKKGFIHRNTANRLKSKLSKQTLSS